jgi:HEAT repeat protein
MRTAREGLRPETYFDQFGDSAAFADKGVATLLSALRDGDDRARREAVALLGQLGPLARDAEPALVALADGGNDRVRRAANRALQSIRAG